MSDLAHQIATRNFGLPDESDIQYGEFVVLQRAK